MAINEQSRQLDIAREVEELTRTLAHSTGTVPTPADSYPMLGELHTAVDHLAQVTRQLASWHRQTKDGTDYDGEDGGKIGSPQAAAADLDTAGRHLDQAVQAILSAHGHNSVVRWYRERR